MYRSYSYNNMPKPITQPPPKPPEKKKEEHKKEEHKKEECVKVPERNTHSILDNLQVDDIILLVVVLALLADDCNDKLLLAALGFIFFSDIM